MNTTLNNTTGEPTVGRYKSSEIALTDAEIIHRAPAAFGAAPHSKLGSGYTLFPTHEVIDALRNVGWHPVLADQSRTKKATLSRNPELIVTKKHLLKFQLSTDVGRKPTEGLGDSWPELVLTNAHNGGSAYQIMAGIFRFVCGNGLVAPESIFETVSIRHSNRTVEEILEASLKVVEAIPGIMNKIAAMQAKQINTVQEDVLALAALKLRYPKLDVKNNAEFIKNAMSNLLKVRRPEDGRSDLWTVFNVLQENIINGLAKSNGDRLTIRRVSSIDEDLRINKGLWAAAEEMLVS